jgi:hypothetical protein
VLLCFQCILWVSGYGYQENFKVISIVLWCLFFSAPLSAGQGDPTIEDVMKTLVLVAGGSFVDTGALGDVSGDQKSGLAEANHGLRSIKEASFTSVALQSSIMGGTTDDGNRPLG